MFTATAKALNGALARRADGEIDPNMLLGEADVSEAPSGADLELARLEPSHVDREHLRHLHAEYRWAESRLMQAAERLAEAQETRRKDLIALERMRMDLKASFTAERDYLGSQLRAFADALPTLRDQEKDLALVVEQGVHTGAAIGELAAVRTERKLLELAVTQVDTQLTVIDENESILDHDTFNERYEREPDGASMRELARRRTGMQRSRKIAAAARARLNETFDLLDLDRRAGELAAISAFLAGELEGDTRASMRADRARSLQIRRELTHLPEPTSDWKAGLRHPISWMRARRISADQ
jgi:hypothetical protein